MVLLCAVRVPKEIVLVPRRSPQLWLSGYGISGYADWSHNLNGCDYREGGMMVGAAWHHELLDVNASFIETTNFGGTPVSAEIFGNNAGRDWFEYIADANFALTDNITLLGDYYLFINNYSALNAGMGTVTWRF